MRWYRQLLAAALCAGLAGANLARAPGPAILLFAAVLVVGSEFVAGCDRLATLAFALLVIGWWWGSARLDVLDRSRLEAEVGRAGRVEVIAGVGAQQGEVGARR
jgi:hypothetical protein